MNLIDWIFAGACIKLAKKEAPSNLPRNKEEAFGQCFTLL